MPIPTPKPQENRQQFLSRCMQDDKLQMEYPDASQRLGVCYSAWNAEAKKTK